MLSLVAAALGLTLSLYAVLGGADFGGGILDLAARGDDKARQRRAIAIVMGPVWEANHVWLIFALTLTFTAFPLAFAVVCEALYVPFSLATVGIVFRGAAFAFRSYGAGARGFDRWPGRIFGVASLVTPITLGASAGALASGRIHTDEHGHFVGSFFHAWTGPLSAAGALLAVFACAYLAASYMAFEANRAHEPKLEDAFRRKALTCGAAMSLLAPAGLAVAAWASPIVFAGLVGHALPVIVLAAATGAASVYAIFRRRYRLARLLTALAIALVLGGWMAAQWPLLVVPDVRADQVAAPDATLRAMLWASAAGAALLGPSLYLLYRVFGKGDARPFVDEE
jgi:cytochrome d ubiquinol oxidase subunit II